MCGAAGVASWAALRSHWSHASWPPWASVHTVTRPCFLPSHSYVVWGKMCSIVVSPSSATQVGILRHRVRQRVLQRAMQRTSAASRSGTTAAATQPKLASAVGAVVPAYCTELASHALSAADTATSTITTRAALLSTVSAPLLDPAVAAWRAVATTRKRSVRVLELCDELSGLLTQEGMWVTLYKTKGVARESVSTPAVSLSAWDALTRPVGLGNPAPEEHGNGGAQQDFWVDSSSDDELAERPGARLREGVWRNAGE